MAQASPLPGRVLQALDIAPKASAMPSMEDLLAMVQQQAKVIEALQARQAERNKISFKVSAKGAISIYGLGKWPITLYASQYRALKAELPALEAFYQAHKAELTEKE